MDDTSWIDRIIESKKAAIREGIEANAIVINKNLVKVPEKFGMYPAMICGLNVHWTDDELPDNYSFAVIHDPTGRDDRLAQFEAIGMEPEELKKAANLYRQLKEMF